MVLERTGLVRRGAFHLEPEEQIGLLAGMQTIVLVGIVGSAGWDAFAASPEASDGCEHPLDRWSRRCLDSVAQVLGGMALYPFDGPPYWPFQRWAQRAEAVYPSPLGLLIHPKYGLWHSYRGAIAFDQKLDWPSTPASPSPCETCSSKPCISACPVGAFSDAGYNVGRCIDWLHRDAGKYCMDRGCASRRGCHVGSEHKHSPAQARFGMAAFVAAANPATQ